MTDSRRQQPRGCRYIEGDPLEPGWSYCQRRQQEGSSYCPEHHARCWVKHERGGAKEPISRPGAVAVKYGVMV